MPQTISEREAELRARFKDVTKPEAPLGSTPESLRQHPGFENITDADLQNRATFNLKDHLAGKSVPPAVPLSVNLRTMTVDELHGLAEATLNEMATRREQENHG